MSDLIDLAQAVARNTGWHVFPCSDNKAPAIPKNEGGNGFHDATVDPDQIARMFSHPGAALIGISTGAKSGFDALDVDVKHSAARAWLLAAQERIPATRIYQTRSGGFHVWFQHADGVKNTESVVARGIDSRGEGGYVVFWFGAGHDCTDHSPIAPWPDWLLHTLLTKPAPTPLPRRPTKPFQLGGRGADAMIASALRKLENASDGSRHAILRAASTTIGGVMDQAGLSEGEASKLLLDAVLVAGGTLVDQRNAAGTIAWGLKRGAASPLILGGK